MLKDGENVEKYYPFKTPTQSQSKSKPPLTPTSIKIYNY